MLGINRIPFAILCSLLEYNKRITMIIIVITIIVIITIVIIIIK